MFGNKRRVAEPSRTGNKVVRLSGDCDNCLATVTGTVRINAEETGMVETQQSCGQCGARVLMLGLTF